MNPAAPLMGATRSGDSALPTAYEEWDARNATLDGSNNVTSFVGSVLGLDLIGAISTTLKGTGTPQYLYNTSTQDGFYVTLPSATTFKGDVNWTMSARMYFPAGESTQLNSHFGTSQSNTATAPNGSFVGYLRTVAAAVYSRLAGSDGNIIVTDTTSFSSGWSTISVRRNATANTIALSWNGVLLGSGSDSTGNTNNQTYFKFLLGDANMRIGMLRLDTVKLTGAQLVTLHDRYARYYP